MMSPGAFNALLKTIEEPPAHVIFILATTEPHKILPTIISRCQRYDFTKVPSKEMIKRIHLILDKEQIQCEDEVVRIITQLSDGGMRDALSILDQCIAYAQNDIKVEHINEIYGILTIKEKLDLLSLVIQKDAKQCMKMIQSIVEKGMDIKRLTTDMIDLLKESIIYEYTKDICLLHSLHKEEAEILNKEADLKKRFDMIDIFMDTYDKYRTAGDLSGYFEICLLKMMDDHKNIVSEQSPMINKIVQNVSRETLELSSDISSEEPYQNDIETSIQEPIQEKKYSIEPLKDEFVVQLLVGANKPERAKQMLYYGLIISVSFGMICTLVCQMIPQQMLALFTSDTQVIKAGSLYLMSYAWDCIFASIHFCFSGYFCGCNKPFISFIHNTISIICIRIPGAYIASQVFPDTLFPMGWAAPLGSLLSAIICIGFYIFLKRKENIKKELLVFEK